MGTPNNTPERQTQFGHRLDLHVGAERAPLATRDLERYLHSTKEPFTGRWFETLTDTDRPNVITEQDLVAVEMLSVTIPPRVSLWVLGEGREQIEEILANVPTNVDLWDRPDLVQEGGDLVRLWRLLSRTANWPTEPLRANYMGRTKTSKLIATKRPRLAPVLDSVVCDALGPVNDRWEAFAHALADEERRRRIRSVVPDGCELSLLRVIDVVVWMAHRHPRPDDPACCPVFVQALAPQSPRRRPR